MPVLLDTSVAIGLLEADPRMMERAMGLDSQFLSVISQMELEVGVYRGSMVDPARRLRLDAFLDEIEVLNFGGDEVAAYSKIIAAKGFSRRLVVDRMIAATAIARALPLVTRNPRDVRDIPHLEVVDWLD